MLVAQKRDFEQEEIKGPLSIWHKNNEYGIISSYFSTAKLGPKFGLFPLQYYIKQIFPK